MKRRDFVKGLSLATAGFSIQGLPVRMMARSLMTQSFSCDEVNDRSIVIIQLSGGNDGLNTIIPVQQYPLYKQLRPVIGIEKSGPRRYIDLDTTLGTFDQVGLNPDMGAIKALYDDGKANIIQNVAYSNLNGSHFKGTDIWLSGRGADATEQDLSTGWWGRYLDHKFPSYPGNYPNNEMADPPGLEFGSCIVSLGFHRQVGIPMGVTLGNDPNAFLGQLTGLGGALPTNIPNSDYGRELQFLVDVEKSTNVYAQRLSDIYSLGSNSSSVTYPETYHTWTTRNYRNGLSPQLKTVARLISGGCKTKVYLVRMGGFDTHANQSIANKPSFGSHSALLYHLSEAVRAFLEDLEDQGLDDRVMLATFSEFGRQVAENSTFGTDHGTSGPMMIFGKGIKAGVTGTNPNLTTLSNNKLVGFQHDYRQVFTTVLTDWLGANPGTLDMVEFREWENKKLDLIDDKYVDGQGNTINYVADPSCDDTPFVPTALDPDSVEAQSFKIWPNPASSQVSVAFESPRLMTATLVLTDLQGRIVQDKRVSAYLGNNSWTLDISSLDSGIYLLSLIGKSGARGGQELLASKKLIVN